MKMAQKGLTVYTAPTTSAHYTAEDDAQLNRGLLSNRSGILESDNQLSCIKIDNNTVQLSSGLYAMQGYLISVLSGTSENLSLDSGTIGAFRKDLVIAEFVRGGGNVDDKYIFRILKGSPASSAGAATDPNLMQDDLTAGGTTRQEVLYRLIINGTNLEKIEELANRVGNYYE